MTGCLWFVCCPRKMWSATWHVPVVWHCCEAPCRELPDQRYCGATWRRRRSMASTWWRRTQQEKSGWKARGEFFFWEVVSDFPKKKEEKREIVFFCLFKMDIVVSFFCVCFLVFFDLKSLFLPMLHFFSANSCLGSHHSGPFQGPTPSNAT